MSNPSKFASPEARDAERRKREFIESFPTKAEATEASLMPKTTQDRIQEIEHALECRDQGEERDIELREELELLVWFFCIQQLYKIAYPGTLGPEDVDAWRDYFNDGYTPQAALDDEAQSW